MKKQCICNKNRAKAKKMAMLGKNHLKSFEIQSSYRRNSIKQDHESIGIACFSKK